MTAKLRAFAKRILPASIARAIAKPVWERIKRRQDKAAFRANYPTVPYIYFRPGEIDAIRAKGYYGQIAQDYFIDLLFDKTDGRFLDIGANNPEANSNTFALEQKGWTGFAFDPMRSLAERWAGRKGTTFVNAGISDRAEVRRFVEVIPNVGWEHQLSSFREFMRAEDLKLYEHIEYDVECAPISSFLTENEVFDFVSIDVEGAEGLILKGMDFDTAPPRAILLENVSEIGGSNEHRRFLEGKGYMLIARIHASDDLFVQRGDNASQKALNAFYRYDR